MDPGLFCEYCQPSGVHEHLTGVSPAKKPILIRMNEEEHTSCRFCHVLRGFSTSRAVFHQMYMLVPLCEKRRGFEVKVDGDTLGTIYLERHKKTTLHQFLFRQQRRPHQIDITFIRKQLQ